MYNEFVYAINTSAKVVRNGGVEKYIWYFIFQLVKGSDATAFSTIVMPLNL